MNFKQYSVPVVNIIIPEWHLLNYEYITNSAARDVCSGISTDVLAAVCLPSSRVRINSETKLNQPYAHLIVIPTSIKAFNFAECLSFTLAQNVSGVIPDCYALLFALELYGGGTAYGKTDSAMVLHLSGRWAAEVAQSAT